MKKIPREFLVKLSIDLSQIESGQEFLEIDGSLSFNGLNQKVYDEYRRRSGKMIQDIRQSNFGEFLDILEQDFIKRNGIDNLELDEIPVVFDMSFSSGPESAAKTVQRTVGVDDDGEIGPKTLKALLDYRKDNDFIDGFSNQRTKFLLDSNDESVIQNLDGLLNRVEFVRSVYNSNDDVIVNPIKSGDSVTVEEEEDGRSNYAGTE